MPPSRPTAAELLDAVRDFLERDILPALAADVRFQCRVAINVLATVRRELELGPAFEGGERDRLTALLGEADARSSLDALNRRLARKIREGAGDLDPTALGDHLRRTMREALQINNPQCIDDESP